MQFFRSRTNSDKNDAEKNSFLISGINVKQLPNQNSQTTRLQNVMRKANAVLPRFPKDQHSHTTQPQHQRQKQSGIVNVKAGENFDMQQHLNLNVYQLQQKSLLSMPQLPPHDNDGSENNKIHHSNSHIPPTGRLIRRPPLWMGYYDNAKAQEAGGIRDSHKHFANPNDDRNDDAENVAKTAVATQRRFGCNRDLWERTKTFIIEFLQDSSIHGFGYLAKLGLNFVERTLWLTFICVAIFSIISLSRRTWDRFQTSPMVISMDRNKLVWNTSFPSLTVCPHKRIDEVKVEEYIISHPDVFVTDEDKESFKEFLDKLARVSYENIDQLPMNKSYGLKGENYLDLLYELKWPFEPEISSGAAVKMHIYETQTEFGICHSVNSRVALYNSYEYRKNNEWHMIDHGERVTVHPLDGEIYAQIINLSTAYDVYFHSSTDIPSITKQRYTFPETDYTTVELIALEITTADVAKDFSPKQRKCRFHYEAENMMTSPIYSFGLCLSECRMFLSLKICKCVPHFYRNNLRNGRVLPVCDTEGLRCVGKLKSEMISLYSDSIKIDCDCLANCDDSNFFVQAYRSRVWFLGANLQWGIIDYPKMQLRRDVLFSFADVLVYIGGLVGFFLGCSALSFTEVMYYFTIRLVKRLFC